jgi:hypothetical protein
MSTSTQQTSPPTKSQQASITLELWSLVAIGGVLFSLGMSCCGHTSWHVSLFIVPIFVRASVLFFRRPRMGLLDQLFGAVAYALVFALLLKNIADILYFGHEPLLR